MREKALVRKKVSSNFLNVIVDNKFEVKIVIAWTHSPDTVEFITRSAEY